MTASDHAPLANHRARPLVGPRPGTKGHVGDKASLAPKSGGGLILHRLTRLPARTLLAMLWLFRRVVSPALAAAFPACGCRFHPTCSCYATEAVRAHGALVGAWLAARRLARCHPFAAGGLDPVPARGPAREVWDGWPKTISRSRLLRGGLQPTAFPAARPICRRAA